MDKEGHGNEVATECPYEALGRPGDFLKGNGEASADITLNNC